MARSLRRILRARPFDDAVPRSRRAAEPVPRLVGDAGGNCAGDAMTATATPVIDRVDTSPRFRVGGWLFTTDHKRMAILTLVVSLAIFFGMGALALVMRAQLAQPQLHLIGTETYNEFFTMHGSGMIYLVVTPFALAFGMYLVPLQIGAPALAAPRLAMFGFWLYVVGAATFLIEFGVISGAAAGGWTAYPPLSDSIYSPGAGM